MGSQYVCVYTKYNTYTMSMYVHVRMCMLLCTFQVCINNNKFTTHCIQSYPRTIFRMSEPHPLAGGKAPDFAAHISVAQKPLVPKRHAITNDYTILTRSLGVGVNGKVLECIHKATGEKRALKVSL